MPAEVMVMCPRCGHPQSAPPPTCARCGAALPAQDLLPPSAEAAPSTPGNRTAQNLAAAALPVDGDPQLWQAELGRGRGLTLSARRLGYRAGGVARSFEVAKLSRVTLVRRPTRWALLLAAVAVVPIVLESVPYAREAGALVGAVGILLFAFRREYALLVQVSSGAPARLPLGAAVVLTPDVERLARIWTSLKGELVRLGVPVDG